MAQVKWLKTPMKISEHENTTFSKPLETGLGMRLVNGRETAKSFIAHDSIDDEMVAGNVVIRFPRNHP